MLAPSHRPRQLSPWLLVLCCACGPAEGEVVPDPGGSTHAGLVDEQPPPCLSVERTFDQGAPQLSPSCPGGACSLARDLDLTCPDDPHFGGDTLRVAASPAGAHLNTTSFNGSYLFRASGQGTGTAVEALPLPQLPLEDRHLVVDGGGRLLLVGVDVGGTLDDRQLLWVQRPTGQGVYFGEPLTSQEVWMDLLGAEFDGEDRLHAWFTEGPARYHIVEEPSSGSGAGTGSGADTGGWVETLRPVFAEGPHSLTSEDLEIDLRLTGTELRAHFGPGDDPGTLLADALPDPGDPQAFEPALALARKPGPPFQAGGADDSLEPLALLTLAEGLRVVGPGVELPLPDTKALAPACFTPTYDPELDSCAEPCVDTQSGVDEGAAAIARDRRGHLWLAWIHTDRLRTTSWVEHCANDPKDPDPPREPPCFCVVESIDDQSSSTAHLARIDVGPDSLGPLSEVLAFDWIAPAFNPVDPEAQNPRPIDVHVDAERLVLGVIAPGQARLIELELD